MGIRVSRWLLGSVVLLAAFLLALPRGELFAQDATLTLQPASGPPGTSVSIEGAFLKCLSRSTEFQILWDGGQMLAHGNTVPTAAFGGYGFYSSFTVPATASAGPHNVVVPAKTAPCWGSPSVVFTVTDPGAPAASPTPSPTASPTVTPTRTPTPVRPGVGGVWVAPEDQAVVADVVQFQARVNPVGTGTPGAIGVDFVAAAASATPAVVCSATFSDADGVYGCVWSPAAAGVPSGEIQISFDVNDQAGQVNRSPNGTRVITYVPATPTPSVQPTPPPVATLEIPTIMATTVSTPPAEELPAPAESAPLQDSELELLDPEATPSSDVAAE